VQADSSLPSLNLLADGANVSTNLAFNCLSEEHRTDITIYLGPFTYDVRQVTLRSGLRIIGMGASGAIISDTWFNTDIGVHDGSGFLLNVATTHVSGIRFIHNQIFGNPDSAVSGTNLAQIVYQDNDYEGYYQGPSNVPPTSGITTQLAPAASISVGGVHSIGLNPSTPPITTIQSSLGPGEMATFFTFAGPVRNDLFGTLQWTPVSQWTAPQAP
jgi:hypothetical protein